LSYFFYFFCVASEIRGTGNIGKAKKPLDIDGLKQKFTDEIHAMTVDQLRNVNYQMTERLHGVIAINGRQTEY
jgi:hypothetical protein